VFSLRQKNSLYIQLPVFKGLNYFVVWSAGREYILVTGPVKPLTGMDSFCVLKAVKYLKVFGIFYMFTLLYFCHKTKDHDLQ
jgi:hypothetical protein